MRGKFRLAAVVLVLIASLASPALAGPAPIDIDVLIVMEIQDVGGWLALHQDVLGAGEFVRPLVVTLPARTGGNRSLSLERPKFTVSLAIGHTVPTVKVAVAGKVNGSEALMVVTPFQHAALEVQSGVVPNEVTLMYGLSGVIGRLLELHISRP
jgi:hypothetical protein